MFGQNGCVIKHRRRARISSCSECTSNVGAFNFSDSRKRKKKWIWTRNLRRPSLVATATKKYSTEKQMLFCSVLWARRVVYCENASVETAEWSRWRQLPLHSTTMWHTSKYLAVKQAPRAQTPFARLILLFPFHFPLVVISFNIRQWLAIWYRSHRPKASRNKTQNNFAK